MGECDNVSYVLFFGPNNRSARFGSSLITDRQGQAFCHDILHLDVSSGPELFQVFAMYLADGDRNQSKDANARWLEASAAFCAVVKKGLCEFLLPNEMRNAADNYSNDIDKAAGVEVPMHWGKKTQWNSLYYTKIVVPHCLILQGWPEGMDKDPGALPHSSIALLQKLWMRGNLYWQCIFPSFARQLQDLFDQHHTEAGISGGGQASIQYPHFKSTLIEQELNNQATQHNGLAQQNHTEPGMSAASVQHTFEHPPDVRPWHKQIDLQNEQPTFHWQTITVFSLRP